MYHKLFLVIAFTLLANMSHASEALIIGSWKCKFKSEIIDADQSLTINNNRNYQLVAKIFGSELTDLGSWSLQNNSLTLNRHTHIKRGKKEKSKNSSSHTIKTLTETTLTYTHGKGISECSRL